MQTSEQCRITSEVIGTYSGRDHQSLRRSDDFYQLVEHAHPADHLLQVLYSDTEYGDEVAIKIGDAAPVLVDVTKGPRIAGHILTFGPLTINLTDPTLKRLSRYRFEIDGTVIQFGINYRNLNRSIDFLYECRILSARGLLQGANVTIDGATSFVPAADITATAGALDPEEAKYLFDPNVDFIDYADLFTLTMVTIGDFTSSLIAPITLWDSRSPLHVEGLTGTGRSVRVELCVSDTDLALAALSTRPLWKAPECNGMSGGARAQAAGFDPNAIASRDFKPSPSMNLALAA
jgi:hypothetical protein